MYGRFREHGYSHGQIHKSKKKVADWSRESLLSIETSNESKGQVNPSPVRVITAFGAQWNTVRSILEKHWSILTNSPGLAAVVDQLPRW